MAIGYSPKLPLLIDSVDGFCKLNKTLGEVAKQNLKMIVLTAPGERVMDPDFGVGARNFLFTHEQMAFQNLKTRIVKQVKKYLPFIQLIDVATVDLNADDVTSSSQYLGLKINYFIPNTSISEDLVITISE